jgi:DNA polymerase III epsilon subunit family exonuclease
MSGLNYDNGVITLTHEVKGRSPFVEKIRIEDLEKFEYRRPGLTRGALTFITKDGRRTQGIEVERRYSKIFDELVAALEADLRNLKTKPNTVDTGSPWKRAKSRATTNSALQQQSVKVAFSGRHETHVLEFIPTEEGFSNKKNRIVLDNVEFAVVDFETTGLHPSQGDRVIQVAVIVADQSGSVLEDWSTYVNPGRDTGAVKIHGISNDQVASAPKFSEIWGDLSRRIENRIIVAHNASFEVKFLLSELSHFGEKIEPTRFAWFDTMILASDFFPGIKDKRQETIAEHLRIDRASLPGGRDHNALTDTHVATKILAHYLAPGPQAVLSNVTWPLVETLPAPAIVSSQAAKVMAQDEDEFESLSAAIKKPPFEKIVVPRGSEIYFTQFYSETHLYSGLLSRLGAIEAKAVTKSRCKLVVTGDKDYVSGAMRKALKFGIPIIHFDHANWLVNEE